MTILLRVSVMKGDFFQILLQHQLLLKNILIKIKISYAFLLLFLHSVNAIFTLIDFHIEPSLLYSNKSQLWCIILLMFS